MNHKKLECLVEGYEGTYFEIGQVWETREGDKLKVKGFDLKAKVYKLAMTEVGDSTEEYYYTLKGEDARGIETEFDLVKLIPTETLTEDNNKREQMEELKLECLVKGYEGTYFEIGQVWETRDGSKIILKAFIDDRKYPLLFDIGDSETEEHTLKGTFFYGEVRHKFDLIKLVPTEIPTEATLSKESQPKTLSEYLKENNAYESFVENCVEEFLNDINWYNKIKIKPKEDSIISLGNTIPWYTTKQGYKYWSDLVYYKPENLVYDMNEIIFAEVDKRIAEQKAQSEFISTEERSPKRYMVFVEGKSSPKKIHTDLDTAEEEAKRLATQEIGSKVFLVEIVKEYKSRLEIDEL